MSGRLDPDLERIALRVVDLLETRAAVARYQRREAERVELVAEVAAFLVENPGASSRTVSRSLHRRRQRVLDAIRELDARERRLPSRRNHGSESAGGTPLPT